MVEVGPQNFHNTIQKLENKSCVGVLASNCNKIHICNSDVEIGVVTDHLDGRSDFFCTNYLCLECICRVPSKLLIHAPPKSYIRDIIAENAIDEHVPFKSED